MREAGCLDTIFRQNRSSLIRFLRCRLKSKDAVDALFQELWGKIQSLDAADNSEPLADIYRMAEDLVLERKRADQGVRKAEHQSDRDHQYGCTACDTDQNSNPGDIDARYFLDRVNVRLENLPKRTAEIFRAVRVEKRPRAELAAALVISDSAVGKHLQRAHREMVIVYEELQADPALQKLPQP